MRREVAAENAYKNGLMFYLGRLTKLNEEMQDLGYQFATDLKKGTVPAGWQEFVDKSLAESQKIVEGMDGLKPPRKYREFHELFVEYHRGQLEDSSAMMRALESMDRSAIEKVMRETEQRENEWKRKIEAAVRRQGAKSLQEFLGFPSE